VVADPERPVLSGSHHGSHANGVLARLQLDF